MSKKIDGILLFLLGIPVFLMAWLSISNPNDYYMSEAINSPYPIGITFIVLVGAMGLTLSIAGLLIIFKWRNV